MVHVAKRELRQQEEEHQKTNDLMRRIKVSRLFRMLVVSLEHALQDIFSLPWKQLTLL